MKLLVDQNLSTRLTQNIQDIFPGSRHVKDVGLERADDFTLWEYAKEHGFAILTKDADFFDLSVVHGSPPVILWLKCGNVVTNVAEALLRHHLTEIQALMKFPDTSCVEIDG